MAAEGKAPCRKKKSVDNTIRFSIRGLRVSPDRFIRL